MFFVEGDDLLSRIAVQKVFFTEGGLDLFTASKRLFRAKGLRRGGRGVRLKTSKRQQSHVFAARFATLQGGDLMDTATAEILLRNGKIKTHLCP